MTNRRNRRSLDCARDDNSWALDSSWGLVLEGEGDFVGGDGAFAEDHPGVAAAGDDEDGGGRGARGGASVDDEWDLVGELGADEVGVGTLRHAAEVGGGGGDGQAEAVDDGACDGVLGHAQGDVAGVGGDAQGKAGAGLDDDGEGAGPEAFGEAVEGGVDLAGEAVGLGGLGDEQGERLVAGAGLDLVDAVDGAQVDGVDGEAVEGVGGQGGDVACGERLDDPGDAVWFGLGGMDGENLCRQRALLSEGWKRGCRWIEHSGKNRRWSRERNRGDRKSATIAYARIGK